MTLDNSLINDTFMYPYTTMDYNTPSVTPVTYYNYNNNYNNNNNIFTMSNKVVSFQRNFCEIYI